MACRKQVSQGTMAFGCSAEEDEHEGPCWARENIRSVRNRMEWEAAQKSAKESGAPLTVTELGMQGEPIPFNTDPEQKAGRRLHPDEIKRLKQPESGGSLEDQIINTAGGVDVDDVLQKDPRYAPYEKRERSVPGNEWKEDWRTSEETGPSGFQAVLDHAPKIVVNNVVQPTKQRPGDQPLPKITDGVAIQDLVIQDIENRKAVGIERYGTILQAHNGRDALLDLYEELLDACIYCKQLLIENE